MKMGFNFLDLAEEAAFLAWKEAKLDHYPEQVEDLIVHVGDMSSLSPGEHAAITQRIQKAGMAVYVCDNQAHEDKSLVRQLGRQFGLNQLDHNMGADEDAITSLSVQEDALHKGYIPYSNRPITWHTDGYYNRMDRQINALILHCVEPAQEGGENALLDHEILYLLLRDINPDYIGALMHPEAMTIPANIVNGEELRPDRTGPVFTARDDGRLHMRYTDRSRSIVWRDDALTKEAVSALKDILRSETKWHFKARLEAGQGLICTNVLHTRTGFTDGEKKRLLYRARYYDEIRV